MQNAVNQRIKKLRKILSLNQTDFAAHLGITQTSLSQIEKEKHGISYDVFRGLVNNLLVNPLWLMNGTGEIFRKDDIDPSLNPSLNPSLISDVHPNVLSDVHLIEGDTETTKTGEIDEKGEPIDEETVTTDRDYSTMKPEDFERLARAHKRLIKKLELQEQLISVLKDEVTDLQQIIEEQQDSEDSGEIRQFGKTA